MRGNVLNKRIDDIIPFGFVLGHKSTDGVDRYVRCDKHHKALVKLGYTNYNKHMVEFCDYCKLEQDIRRRGQLNPVILHSDGKTITGSGGNHRAIVIGHFMKMEAKCIQIDVPPPSRMMDWLNYTSIDDMVVPSDMISIMKWIEVAYIPGDDQNNMELAEKIFRYREKDVTRPKHRHELLDDVDTIHNYIIPFIEEHPEFNGKIGRPGSGHAKGWGQLERTGEIIAYNMFKTMIKRHANNIEANVDDYDTLPPALYLKDLGEVITDESLAIKTQGNKIGKLNAYWKNTKKTEKDMVKLYALRDMARDLPIGSVVLDLFARNYKQSTTSTFLNLGHKVVAVGNEIDKYMRNEHIQRNHKQLLSAIDSDVYTWTNKNKSTILNRGYNWINLDPFGYVPILFLRDLAKSTDNLSYVLINWNNWTCRGEVLDKARAEMGLQFPSTFTLYCNTVRDMLSDMLGSEYLINIHNVGKDNRILHIKRQLVC